MRRPKGTHPIYWRSFPYAPPSDWKNLALSELADKTKGKLASDLTSKASEGARPYLLTGHLNGAEAPQFTVSEDIPDVAATDTVMAVDGTVGKVFTGLDGALGSTMMRFRPKNINDSDFLCPFGEAALGWAGAAEGLTDSWISISPYGVRPD